MVGALSGAVRCVAQLGARAAILCGVMSERLTLMPMLIVP
jgi:hypothetical protein